MSTAEAIPASTLAAPDEDPKQFEEVAPILGVTTARLQELEAKHKTIGIVVSSTEVKVGTRMRPAWAVVVRKPNRTEYKLFKANSNNPQKVSEAQEALFKAICIVPEGYAAIEALLDEWPGVPEACANSGTLQKLSGMAGTEQGKY